MQRLSPQEIGEVPNYKPFIAKYLGTKYETVNPWRVYLFTTDSDQPGRYRMLIRRRDPVTGRNIDGEGHDKTMWRDEAIQFCLQNSYLRTVTGIKLTAEERSLLAAIVIAVGAFLTWFVGA